MARLPDVPLEVWTGYIQDQFHEKTNGLMDALEFRVKTSPFGEMFPAVSPQDNPMLSTYEQQLQEDATEQEKRREEEMQRLQQEQQYLMLRQEQAELMQRLAPPEPTPLDPSRPDLVPGTPFPDTQPDPQMGDQMYRGQVPEDGAVPGTRDLLYRGAPDLPTQSIMFKESQAKPQEMPPPMFEAPEPVQGQNFNDYSRQLREMLGGERNSSYVTPPEPVPTETNPVAPAEPMPVGADVTQDPQPGLRNFQNTFNQEMDAPQDRPMDQASADFWEPVNITAGKVAKKSQELGLGEAWAAAQAALDPQKRADLTRIAIGKTLQVASDAVPEGLSSPLIAAAGERETNPLAKANPLASGKVGDLPGAEATIAGNLLRDVEIPGLKGVGDALGIADEARYLPTDLAANFANGPGRALEVAQWLGVAGQALENPASPATAMLSTAGLGLAGRYGLKGLGKLADSSVDPLDNTRTGVVADAAPEADRFYHGTGADFTRLDPEKGKAEGLFGSNVAYMTDDPRVAGSGNLGLAGRGQRGYAEQAMDPEVRSLLGDIDYAQRTLVERADEPDVVAHMQQRLQNAEEQLGNLGEFRQSIGMKPPSDAGPNVRPINVPRDLNLLDADAPAPPELIERLRQVIPDDGKLDRFEYEMARVPRDTGEGVYGTLRQVLADEGNLPTGGWMPEGVNNTVNQLLQDAGYDGIRYKGGQRMPMQDAAGKDIEHTALAIFPKALDKITNATAGTPGGFLPGDAGTNLARTARFATSGVQGAVQGGLGAAEEEDADVGDIARGAALGAARGLGGRAIRGTGAEGAWASNIAKAEWNLSFDNLYKDQPRTRVEDMPENIQGKAWAKLNQARDYLSERFFDNRTYVNKLQGEARRYLGRDLTYDEMLSEHSRRNTSQAAQVAIDQMLRPAVNRVGPYIDQFKNAMTYRDNIAVSNAKARQVYANEAARQTPGVQAAEREVRRLEKMQNSPNAPMDLHVKLDEARTRLDEELEIREGEAWQTGGMAGEGRSFSGDVDVRESQARLAEIEEKVGPEVWKTINEAMDETQAFVNEYRQRMYDHGIINKKTLDSLQQFDFYIPTRILDHINDESKVAVGGSVSLRDTGIHEASIKGTTKEREDPINSLMRLAFDSEARIAKNDAFNAFHALNAETPVFSAKSVSGTEAKAKMTSEGTRSKIVTGFVDGKKVAYEVNDPWTAKALNFEKDPISNRIDAQVMRKLSTLTRELITRNPAFIAKQLLLDVSGAVVRETSWEGGPQNTGRVVKALMQAYFDPDLWRGLDSGQYKGDYARFLREGGGMAGFQDMTQEALLKKQGDLQRSDPFDKFEVNNKEDWVRVLKWLGKGEAFQNVSTRLDLAPRVAAARLAEERLMKQGVDPNSAKLRGMIAGRESTMDFSKGGSLTKTLNQFIPFFNIGFQAAATPIRALRENPVAFPATMITTIGVPVMAAEVWNRSDPQRARDYEDIPDYIKARNLVVMMPEVPGTDIGKAGVDEFGGRRPKYVTFPLREFGVFGVLARAAAKKAIESTGGDVRDPDEWNKIGKDLLSIGSPITANNPTDLTTAFSPVGLSTALQMSNNKDAFRGRQIATERNDMEASNISKGISNFVFDKFGLEWRPSQVEFVVRDMGGHTGAAVLAGGDALTRRVPKDEGAPSTPVVGGVVKGFYGNATGQRLNDAREHQLSGNTVKTLRQFGLRSDQIAPVPATLQNIQLSRAEQTAWQSAFNSEFETELAAMQQSSLWIEPDADHAELIRKAAATARARTGKNILNDMSSIERQERQVKGVR